jgi:hypothetical protein
MENASEKTPKRGYDQQVVQDCIKDADLVISGKVSNVSKVEYDENHPISKHDPNWNEATISIDNVEKGSRAEKEIKVLFPQSDHISWHKAPKLGIGHEATYILHKEPIPQLNGKEAYTVLHETDVHSKDDVDKIKRLVNESRS